MATNFIAPGKNVDIVAPSGGVTAGIPVVLGQMFGVPLVSAVSGANAVIATGGIWTLPKLNAASMSMAVGANVHWDATNSQCTVSATSNTKLGVAVVAASNTDATVRVRLNGNF